MAKRNTDFTLNTIDELFTNQEEWENANMPKIRDIPIDIIDDFPNHPFKVRMDDEMIKLIESVSENGVITPAIVREKENGRYEMISGHRRKFVNNYLHIENLRCIVMNLTDIEATIIMVDSNIQRENVPPSEKAFAYKMRLEAMKRPTGRPKKNYSPLGNNFATSSDELAKEMGESKNQIYRYIRLTYLVVELLEFVDAGKIKMRPAVELSYLDEDSQRDLVDFIDDNECYPSHAQAIRMRKLFDEGNLNTDVITDIMSEKKPNQRDKIIIRGERFEKLMKNVPLNKREDYVCKAIEHYNKYLRNREEREAR